jgi:hypothetical protein
MVRDYAGEAIEQRPAEFKPTSFSAPQARTV